MLSVYHTPQDSGKQPFIRDTRDESDTRGWASRAITASAADRRRRAPHRSRPGPRRHHACPSPASAVPTPVGL